MANSRGGGRMENTLRNGNALLYVVRHGDTELNNQNRFRGFQDVPIDDNGKQSARDAREQLSGIEFGHTYSSDMQRSIMTERILNDDGYDFTRVPELRPLNVGGFAGKEKTQEARNALDQYVNNPDVKIPGGESLNDFKARVRPVINGILEHAKSTGKPNLLIAHSSTIHELGDMFHGDHNHVKVKPGGIVKVSLNHGKPVVSAVSGVDETEKDRIS